MFQGNYWAPQYWGEQYWHPQTQKEVKPAGGSGGKWKKFSDVKSNRPLKLGRQKGAHYSAYYVKQVRKVEKAQLSEGKKADKVSEAEERLAQLIAEKAAESAERKKAKRLLEARKRALEAAQIKTQALFAEAERLRREEDDAIALLLLVG